MRQWSKQNIVYISEVRAPDDFICVWSKEAHRSASQSNKTRYKNVPNKMLTFHWF